MGFNDFLIVFVLNLNLPVDTFNNEIFTTHYSEPKEQGLDSAHTT